jgi:hypothetical protein
MGGISSGPMILELSGLAFRSLTDPPPVYWWPRNKAIDPVALSSDLTPLVINSGDTISIKLFPLGQDKVAVIEYLQLTLVNADTAPEPRLDSRP